MIKKSVDAPLSYEDKMFMNNVKGGVHQMKDRHYELPLSLKNDKVKLPNNKVLAQHRLKKIKD